MRPVHPRLILLLAIILPGSGHVALGRVPRALGFIFFMKKEERDYLLTGLGRLKNKLGPARLT